jgi:hypothetical protein
MSFSRRPAPAPAGAALSGLEIKSKYDHQVEIWTSVKAISKKLVAIALRTLWTTNFKMKFVLLFEWRLFREMGNPSGLLDQQKTT